MAAKLDDVKTGIYNAAKSNKVNEMRRLIEAQHKDDITEIVSSKVNGATPLIVACVNGHIEVVQYLIDGCAADIEQVGSFIYDPFNVYPRGPVTPLSCAVFKNRTDIVIFLISRGADVRSVVYNPPPNKTSPLTAACEQENFLLAQYLVDNKADVNITNDQGMTCLMVSCSKSDYKAVHYLINNGADVNKTDHNGDTALHWCVRSGHSTHLTTEAMIEIMKLLLKCKAKMQRNSSDMTPLLIAAANANARIVEYLIDIDASGRREKIDALELLGSTLLARGEKTLALTYWRWAMEERCRDGFDVMPKLVNPEPNPAYDNAVEVETPDELDGLISDPDAMCMQALLVRERILGPAHPETLQYIVECGGCYHAFRFRSDKCLRLWTYALELHQKAKEPLHWRTRTMMQGLVYLFSSMMKQEECNVDFESIMAILDKSVYELERSKPQEEKFNEHSGEESHTPLENGLVITLNIIGLMCTMQSRFSEEQVDRFKTTIYKFVHLDLRGSDGATPLHITCEGDIQIEDFKFPYIDVAKILVELRASVHTKNDANGYTPLHVAAISLKEDLMRVLLEEGAHIDAHDYWAETPIDLLWEQGEEGGKIATALKSLSLKYTTLQCLAARVIVDNKIPYEGIVSKNVEDFVALH